MEAEFLAMLLRTRFYTRPSLAAALALLSVLALAGCQVERRKSDAELGLNPTQALGRRVFDAQCARCHDPYSKRGRNGPGLTQLYKKKYMPSGMPANDERITEVILRGHAKMPAFGAQIGPSHLAALLEYLKTL